MNVLTLLILKKDVYYLNEDDTLRQAIEKMNFHHHQNIPILSIDGHYINSISSGDVLAYLSENELGLHEAEAVSIGKVKIYRPIRPLRISTSLEEIRDCLSDQNYVPIVDDQGVFIGIITRRRFVQTAMRLK